MRGCARWVGRSLKHWIRIILVAALLVVGTVGTATADDSAESAKLERAKAIAQESRAAEKEKKNAAPPSFASSGVKMTQGLALCVAILLIGAFLAKKFKVGAVNSGARSMKVLERLPLTPKTALLLAEVQGQRVILSVGSEQVQFLKVAEGESAFASSLDALTTPESHSS